MSENLCIKTSRSMYGLPRHKCIDHRHGYARWIEILTVAPLQAEWAVGQAQCGPHFQPRRASSNDLTKERFATALRMRWNRNSQTIAVTMRSF